MVRIRLQRHGRPKKAFYRIVAIDSCAKQKGQPIESIGYYDPMLAENSIKIDQVRLDYWMKCGAKMSHVVGRLLKKSDVKGHA